MEQRWQRTRTGFGIGLVALGVGVYAARAWLQEQLPLLEQWPVLLVVAPALTISPREAPQERQSTAGTRGVLSFPKCFRATVARGDAEGLRRFPAK